MRRILTGLLLLGCPLPVRAGIYSTAEPLSPLIARAGANPLDFGDFKALRDDRRAPLAGKDGAVVVSARTGVVMGIVGGNDIKRMYRRKSAALADKIAAGNASVDDKINLSAYLIGLGRYNEAARLLEPEARGAHQGNFMVLANLATAYFQVGQLDRAAAYQRQLLENWPRQAPGFTAEQLQWLRGVETKLWVLYMLRSKEANESVKQISQPDDLFKVRFVGKDGTYTPGKLPDGQQLPADALAITQQLILWLPFENRLHWLLAEILNAQGQQQDALGIFDELIWGGFNVRELKEHRTAIQASLPAADPPPFFTLTPRGLAILALIGGIMLLFIWLQLRESFRRSRQLVGP